MNNGVANKITKTVENALNRQVQNDLKDSGIPCSVASMSLEKRLMIRPDGVVSKKPRVDFRIEFKSSL